jgi:hypothetical protein
LHAARAAASYISDGAGAFVDVSMRDAIADAVATPDAPARYVVTATEPEALDTVMEPVSSTVTKPQREVA